MPPESPNSQDQPIKPRRSWNDLLHYTPSILRRLPTLSRPTRYTRADAIPDTEPNPEDGLRPTVRDYYSITATGGREVRVPKKIPTPVRVEGKVWFANERTWISWLNLSVLIATLALVLFNASEDNQVARMFAYAYAIISVGVLIYGYLLYQHRITMIRRRDPGHFDNILGPVLISALLFFAVLANFVIRARELQRKNIPIPGAEYPNLNLSLPFSFSLAGFRDPNVLNGSTAQAAMGM